LLLSAEGYDAASITPTLPVQSGSARSAARQAAGHSFLNHKPNGPLLFRPVAKLAHAGPEPAAAADAWRRIEAFFAVHLAD
jgi:dienelactone hydrolase